MKYNDFSSKITCSFTGHRPSKFLFGYDEDHPDCKKLKKTLAIEIESLICEGYHTFQSGLAEGTDTYCAEIVLELKKQYPHVTLLAAIPCYNQEKRWSQFSQKRYHKILDCCDIVHYVTCGDYTNYCMHERNKYLVETSDAILAVYDGSAGGTRNTISYAEKLNKKLIIIDPQTSARVMFFSQNSFF